ncbi:MAG: YciE/YciF ferroxidase family protein [Solirubrobacteraceae bacterium]
MADTTTNRLLEHLRDAHAIEEQSLRQLERACELAADDETKQIYRDHLEESREHEKLIRERLEAHEHKPSAVKDLTMRSGAVGLRQLADVAPDTPVKLAMHFYAFEHLEVATYAMLEQIAKDTGDDETAQIAEQILEQERAAAEQVCDTFARAVERLLQADAEQEADGTGEDEDEDEDGEDPGENGARFQQREPAEATT